jgi:hypothetical protein
VQTRHEPRPGRAVAPARHRAKRLARHRVAGPGGVPGGGGLAFRTQDELLRRSWISGPAPPLPGSSCWRARTADTMREGRVRAKTLPRHARAPAEWRWVSLMTELGLLRPPAGAWAPPPAAGHDPLVDPVPITGHCVIGDQIRRPAAWCDIPGCTAGFADPAALGEADNRARALAAGWRADALGRLVCPACRQATGVTGPRGQPASGPRPAAAPGRPLPGLGPARAGAHRSGPRARPGTPGPSPHGASEARGRRVCPRGRHGGRRRWRTGLGPGGNGCPVSGVSLLYRLTSLTSATSEASGACCFISC